MVLHRQPRNNSKQPSCKEEKLGKSNNPIKLEAFLIHSSKITILPEMLVLQNDSPEQY